MKHTDEIDAGIVSGIEQEKRSIKTKENKMEGIDPSLVALLQNKGGDDYDQTLRWLIVLGFLGRRGGLFGGDDAGGASAGATQAKLDCLSQGQQDAAMSAHNTNMVNLSHSNEMATQNGFNRLASQMAECCCDLRAGQKDIVNELCKQTQVIVAASVSNTQRIVDVVNVHANTETQSKLTDCKAALSNANQTKEIAGLISECCSDGHRGSK